MRIETSNHLTPDGRGVTARQSRWGSVILALVMAAAFVGSPIFLWYNAAPTFFTVLFALFSLLIVPLLIGDLFARFRRENWLLWLAPEGIWINLRSYQVAEPGEPHPVLFLDYGEVASASTRLESFTVPFKSQSSKARREHSLELRLNHDDTADLKNAIAAERSRPGRRRQYGGLTITTRPTLFSVHVPDPDLIRLIWRGGKGDHVTPSLNRAITELESHGIPRGEPSRADRPRWDKLTDAETDDLIRRLVASGDRLDAIKLLKKRRRMTTTEAKRYVDELAERV